MDQDSQNYWQPEDKNQQSLVSPEDESRRAQDSSVASQNTGPNLVVEWRASEYIHHEKGASWFIVLAVVTFVAAGLAAIFQQWFFAALIIVMGAALWVYAKRPPHEVYYRLDNQGVMIEKQMFPYEQFRSFGVLDEGAFYAVQLRPAKRFMPGIVIYFAQEDGERIFDALAAHLPAEEVSQDIVDKFMRWLRF